MTTTYQDEKRTLSVEVYRDTATFTLHAHAKDFDDVTCILHVEDNVQELADMLSAWHHRQSKPVATYEWQGSVQDPRTTRDDPWVWDNVGKEPPEFDLKRLYRMREGQYNEVVRPLDPQPERSDIRGGDIKVQSVKTGVIGTTFRAVLKPATNAENTEVFPPEMLPDSPCITPQYVDGKGNPVDLDYSATYRLIEGHTVPYMTDTECKVGAGELVKPMGWTYQNDLPNFVSVLRTKRDGGVCFTTHLSNLGEVVDTDRNLPEPPYTPKQRELRVEKCDDEGGYSVQEYNLNAWQVTVRRTTYDKAKAMVENRNAELANRQAEPDFDYSAYYRVLSGEYKSVIVKVSDAQERVPDGSVRVVGPGGRSLFVAKTDIEPLHDGTPVEEPFDYGAVYMTTVPLVVDASIKGGSVWPGITVECSLKKLDDPKM